MQAVLTAGALIVSALTPVSALVMLKAQLGRTHAEARKMVAEASETKINAERGVIDLMEKRISWLEGEVHRLTEEVNGWRARYSELMIEYMSLKRGGSHAGE